VLITRFVKTLPARENVERQLKEELAAIGLAGCDLHVHQRSMRNHEVYEVRLYGCRDNREALKIRTVVLEKLAIRRGRPTKPPAHQIACRVPVEIYQRLVRAAKRKKMTVSSLLAEVARAHVGR
jgi:hypothetical protein